MNLITVSKAFSRSTITVILPMIIVLFGGMIAILLLGLNNILNPVAGISGIVFLFAAAILVAMYLTDKWKIWAIKNVDDVPALIERYENQNTFFKQKFIKTSFLTSQKDKEMLVSLFRQRVLDGTLRIKMEDDITFPTEIVVKGANLDNLVIGILIIIFPFISKLSGKQVAINPQARIILAFIIFVGAYFLYNYFFGKIKMKLSGQGFWTKQTGDCSWSDVGSIYIADGMEIIHQGAIKKVYLVIKFKPVPGLPQGVPDLELDLKKVNKTANQIEKAIKIYLIRFQKSTGQTIIFGRR